MNLQNRYTEASVKTADNLRTIAHSSSVRELSRLSLPEVDAIVNEVSRVIPAGNVPGVILSGLARLSERKPSLDMVKRDINLLFKGIEQVLDKALYGAFFAGPAAVIWGYQNLLKLAGASPEHAFPEGTWQFYVGYALREDTARHAYETHGFDTLLNQHHIRLSAVDRITAWTMAAIHCMYQYNALLENEWRERVYLYLLEELTREQTDAARYGRLYNEWEKVRPYKRGADTDPLDDYPTYRRRKFDHFVQEATGDLAPDVRRTWTERVRQAERHALPAYQRQMSILAFLDPGPYDETRTPIALSKAHIGLVYRGGYFMMPVGAERPADVAVVRARVAAMLQSDSVAPAGLAALTGVRRATLPKLLPQLNEATAKSIAALRHAPILINCDPRPRHLPLAELRQAERGVGDHAVTIFDTGETFVFDHSHIFFDGGWGAALSEILTNEALSWAVYLHNLPPAQPAPSPVRPLVCQFRESERELIRQSPGIMPEASAETDAVDLKAILKLRKLFKQRNDLIQLTVNDLLILYRAFHALTYQPDPDLVWELEAAAQREDTMQAAQSALGAIQQASKINPSILIPIDASQRSPRERLYPMSFEVPLEELDLLNLHRQVMQALNAYESGEGDRTALYAEFDELQRKYLAALAGFGTVMNRAKEVALRGESASVSAIKLLAHMPTPLQRMLDQIPTRFEALNDIVKGREVLSNMGVVAPTSTLLRFITAKDDNDKKTLAWGVITDARGVMHISLRDFRPHVDLLAACGREDLPRRIARHYVETYAAGLNSLVADLQRITRTSRETRLRKPE